MNLAIFGKVRTAVETALGCRLRPSLVGGGGGTAPLLGQGTAAAPGSPDLLLVAPPGSQRDARAAVPP